MLGGCTVNNGSLINKCICRKKYIDISRNWVSQIKKSKNMKKKIEKSKILQFYVFNKKNIWKHDFFFSDLSKITNLCFQ